MLAPSQPNSTLPHLLLPLCRRDSKWANSALVVAVQPSDWDHLTAQHGPLAGMALQQQGGGWVSG